MSAVKMRIRKLIWQGERYPRGYGMAWLDFQRNAAVCYPIPLNVIVRAAYLVWVWCLCPFGVTERELAKSRIAFLEAEKQRLEGDVLSLIKRKDSWIEEYDRLRAMLGPRP